MFHGQSVGASMKVGDLVRCPAFDGHAMYFGIVVGVWGHKVDVFGGTHRANGIVGHSVWDICDIHPV